MSLQVVANIFAILEVQVHHSDVDVLFLSPHRKAGRQVELYMAQSTTSIMHVGTAAGLWFPAARFNSRSGRQLGHGMTKRQLGHGMTKKTAWPWYEQKTAWQW